MTQDSKLPDGWQILRFDQFAENIAERVDPAEADVEYYVGLEHLDPESLKIRRWGTPEDVKGTKLRFRKGDIIFGRRRFYQRKVAVTEFNGICSAHAMVLRARESMMLQDLLPFFLQSETFFQRAMQISVGSLSPTINWRTLARQEFAIPPLDEQRRIAEILWAADDAFRAKETLWEKLKEAKNVYFEKTSRSEDRTSIREARLHKIALLITDGDHNPPSRISEGIPHVVVKNIVDSQIDLSDCTYISPTDYERVKKRYDPKPGDLIVTCVGSVGRVALVPEGLQFSADRSLAIIRFDPGKVLPAYGRELMNSRSLQKQMERRSIGTAQQHLYLGDIRSLHVRIPPLRRQEEILSKMHSFDCAIDAAMKSLTDLKELKVRLREGLLANSRSMNL
jgi:restriction endonuclease S subunit